MYTLISEIEDLPNSVKKQLFDELLDANAQKGCTFAKYNNSLDFILYVECDVKDCSLTCFFY